MKLFKKFEKNVGVLQELHYYHMKTKIRVLDAVTTL